LNDATLVETDDTSENARDRAHVMLDQEHRNSSAADLCERRHEAALLGPFMPDTGSSGSMSDGRAGAIATSSRRCSP
jgi:hypothetical protein